jgi:hypothetical protein
VQFYSFLCIFTTVEKITIRWIKLSDFRTTGPWKEGLNQKLPLYRAQSAVRGTSTTGLAIVPVRVRLCVCVALRWLVGWLVGWLEDFVSLDFRNCIFHKVVSVFP